MRYPFLIGRWREAEGRLPARNEGRQLFMDWSGQQSMRKVIAASLKKSCLPPDLIGRRGSKGMSGFSRHKWASKQLHAASTIGLP